MQTEFWPKAENSKYSMQIPSGIQPAVHSEVGFHSSLENGNSAAPGRAQRSNLVNFIWKPIS